MMKQLSYEIFKFLVLRVGKIFQTKPDIYDRYQCETRSSSAGEFNCCVKKMGHKGMHMSADGNKWF